jgi:hypothetical protein
MSQLLPQTVRVHYSRSIFDLARYADISTSPTSYQIPLKINYYSPGFRSLVLWQIERVFEPDAVLHKNPLHLCSAHCSSSLVVNDQLLTTMFWKVFGFLGNLTLEERIKECYIFWVKNKYGVPTLITAVWTTSGWCFYVDINNVQGRKLIFVTHCLLSF